MDGHEIDARTAEEALAFVRALGKHRYVDGRVHLVHALALDAAPSSDPLAEAKAWARAVLRDPDVDPGSRDERLLRAATDDELLALLAAYWAPGAEREATHVRLRNGLAGLDVTPSEGEPFDESDEEDVFPRLVDAGWQLLGLPALDPERHRGAREAFEDALAFDVARHEDEVFVPARLHFYELPLLGARELLGATDAAGALLSPLVLWTEGHPVYLGYVLSGVLKAAKLAR